MSVQTLVHGTPRDPSDLKEMLCSIPHCGKPYEARGWCANHYYRWRAHGDPLGGRTPNGEPLRYFREVVLAYDGDECLIWSYGKNSKGCGTVVIEGRSRRVPRLVCEAVDGPPPTPEHEAAHGCGNGHLACVTKGHLSWKTPSGNQMDRVTHGTSNRGAAHPMAKLTEAEIVKTRSLYRKIPTKELAAMVGVSTRHVGKIGRVQAWSWLEEE